MEKLFSKIEEPLMRFGDKINGILFFNVLRDAFMVAFPVIIFGSLVTIIANFPFLDDIIGADAAKQWTAMLTPASNASMNIMSIFVAMGIGYYYSKAKECDGIFGAAVCVCAFFVLFPWVNGYLFDGTAASAEAAIADGTKAASYAPIGYIGAKGMFVAIFVSFITTAIFCFVTNKDIVIKMPAQVPPAVSKSFAALIPASCALIVSLVVAVVFQFLPWGDLFTFVYQFVQAPLTALGSSFAATLIAIFFVQFFWFFGLHGQIIVNSVMDPIWNSLMSDNFALYSNGEAVTNIVTKPFMEVFTVGLGGSGATLIVVIMLVAFTRSKQLKDLGKLALPAGIFNVNEPFIFGLPIIFNPLVVIPWILAPMVSVSIAYFAMFFGLVPLTTGVAVPWTVPILISGALATNSWQGAVLQLVQMAAVGVIWFPFVRMIDRRYFKVENADSASKQDVNETKKD